MCKHCTIVLFICLLAKTAAAQISPDSLVLYMPLNGDAKDYSGNNYDGVIYNATTTEGFNGKKNTAFNFDGNSAIIIPNIPKLEGPIKAFSLLIRLLPSIPRREGIPFYNIFSWQRHGPDPNENYAHGKLRVGWSPPSPNYHPLYDFFGYFGDWCTGNIRTANGYEMDTATANEQWQTIALVYNQGNLRVYFDCKTMSDWIDYFPKVSDLCGNYPMEILLGTVSPGIAPGTNFKNFIGKIDEVRFYKRALSNSEVVYFADSVCKQLVAPKPVIAYAINPCQPNEVSFSDSGSIISHAVTVNRHVWKISNGDSAVGGSFTYRFPQVGNYTVRLSLYSGNDVFSRDTVIKIAATGTARFIKAVQANVFSCVGSSVQLNVSGGVSYSWLPCDGLSDCKAASPFVKSDVDVNYIVTAQDANKCTDTAHLSVKITKNDNSVYVPNAFTPNGDNHNDTWGVTSINPLLNFNLRVFNRWGINVFTAKSQDTKWNGTLKNEKAQPGAYVYMLTYKNGSGCTDKSIKGTVLLIP